MTEFLGIAFALSFFAAATFAVLYDTMKKDVFVLERDNNKLREANSQLQTANQRLFEEVKEMTEITEEQKKNLEQIIAHVDIHEYPVDTKVSWIDKSGGVEHGVVVDDSKIDGKTYVHLRRLNKKGKFVGGIITIQSNKLNIEN